MIKNKIKMLLNYRNKLQLELMDVLGVSSKQALNNKIALERFSLQEFITICDYLNCTISIQDNETGKEIVTFDKSDLKGE